MTERMTVYEGLRRRGVSRRGFLKLCAYTSSTLALPAGSGRFIAEALAATPRPPVVWLSFQECTGCTESFLRSFNPTMEDLILGEISLEYHHTLQAASGEAAEQSRRDAIAAGGYVLMVDGSVSTIEDGAWSTIAGETNLAMLKEAALAADIILNIGNCATFGGVAKANPNPTGARGVDEVLDDAFWSSEGIASPPPIINVPGCPPVPEVIGGVVVAYLMWKNDPSAPPLDQAIPLDSLRRPTVFYGQTVHDSCVRRPFFDARIFAQSFDDDLARQGACLRNLGCRGPETHNACTTISWNQGLSFPMYSGHGCIGCSEPDFWDREGGWYTSQRPTQPPSPTPSPTPSPK